MNLWKQLFTSGDYMPHGFCYLWNTRLVLLNGVSDLLIALSYFAIPIILLWFIRKRRDLPFSWMFALFGVFIVACGATHVMEVWNLWHAQYWLAGAVKAITAAASVPTAILLARLMPQALALPSAGEWMQANAALTKEVQEHRDAETNLRASEASYRDTAELLDLTQDAIFVSNLKNEVQFMNRAAEKLYGWQKEEAQGRAINELLQTAYPKPLPEVIAEILAEGSWEGELVHRRREGTTVIVSSRWVLRRDHGGSPIAILQSNRDITQRKNEEAKFRNLLEAAPDAIVIVDGGGTIRLVNSQTERLFGYGRAELLGQKVEALLPERYSGKHPGHREQFFGDAKVRPMGAGLELFARCKDGTEIPVEISLSPIETTEGRLVSSAIRDITEHKKAQAALTRQSIEMAFANASLTAVNKELESFSYSVSHDLRAPLRSIDGFSHALLEDCYGGLDAAGKDHLQRIRKATQQMGMLIEDLLNLARISRIQMNMQTTDISALVRSITTELQEANPERGVEWKIENGLEAKADTGLLKVALENLLGNAWKFTSKRARAHIEFGKAQVNGTTAYFLRDDGAGFNPAYAARLFGTFQRLHSNAEFPGTGVGLATVQRIVHRHGGSIWAESAEDKGATFYFTLANGHG